MLTIYCNSGRTGYVCNCSRKHSAITDLTNQGSIRSEDFPFRTASAVRWWSEQRKAVLGRGGRCYSGGCEVRLQSWLMAVVLSSNSSTVRVDEVRPLPLAAPPVVLQAKTIVPKRRDQLPETLQDVCGTGDTP